MHFRRSVFVVGVFLLLFALSAHPAAAAPEAVASSCAVVFSEGGTQQAVSPLEPAQAQFILDTSCTTSAQCSTGQTCSCGLCHTTCSLGFRWNCTCQVCYKCGSGQFFDDSICACAAI